MSGARPAGLRAGRRGDPEVDDALRHLQDVERPGLIAFAARFTNGDRYRAEDIVQETLVRAWRHPEERDAHGHWSRPWLRTVARRIAIDQIRAANVRPPEWPFDPAAVEQRSTAADETDRLIDRREVLSALASLNAQQRAVLVETYLRERTAVEAARTLGVPVGTVRSRSFYALRALRDTLLRRGFPAR